MSEVPKSYSHISARLEKFLEPWGEGEASRDSRAVAPEENKPEGALNPSNEDEILAAEYTAPAEKRGGATPMDEVQKSYGHDSTRLEEFLEPWGKGEAPAEVSRESRAVAPTENKPEDALNSSSEDEVSAAEYVAPAEREGASPSDEVQEPCGDDSARLDELLEPRGEGVVQPEKALNLGVENEVSAHLHNVPADSDDVTSQNVSRSAGGENSETNGRVQTIYEYLRAAKAVEVAEQSPMLSDEAPAPNNEDLRLNNEVSEEVAAQSPMPSEEDATPHKEILEEVVAQSLVPSDEGPTPNGEAGGIVNPESRHWSERIPVWRSIKAIQRQVTALEVKSEAQVTALDAKYGAQISELDAKHGAQISELDAKHGAQISELDAKHGAQISELDAKHGAQISELDAKYDAQVAALEEKYETQLQLSKALEDRMTELSRYLGFERGQDPAFDRWYQSLQDLHRGSSEELELLQSSYLPYFEVRAPVLQPAGPVLDLGCGRGEWLSMMAQQGWQVRGVDSSELAVKAARERGIEVLQDDLLTALESQPANSLAAVTAFQVIEHLPFECVVALVQAAFQALLPGGILLFETPNPENLQVATYSFWMDPTHKKPIPPPLLMDLSFHAGFRDGLVLRQNPWPNWQGEEAEPSLEGQMNQRLYGPQDYALLAYKPVTSS